MTEDFTSYRPGDRQDFDRLYRESYHRILYTLMGILRDREAAEDCAQETFARAYRAWRHWKPEAPPEAWLHRIALNVATSHRRRERRHRLGAILRRDEPSPPGLDPHGASELLAALRRIPARDAALIVLRHHHGYSNREIAAALGMRESTISSRLAAAKRRLQRELRVDDVVTGPS
jgi:RNA polymerase sigma-70 factor (ECF subfamily)